MATRHRYTVVVSPAAGRALKKIKDRAVLRRHAAALDALETEPRPSGLTILHAGDRLYRIRVGDYRIIYRIEDDVLTVTVVKIGHRRDIYLSFGE